MNNYQTLDDFDPAGKRVLVRVDLNVPTRDGRITDDTRIVKCRDTVNELADKGAKVVILSHFGRPKGVEPKLSLQFLVEPLAKALGRPVAWSADTVGKVAMGAVKALKNGDVLLMENVRFHEDEEMNDPGYIRALTQLGDIYVNDAFSAAHRLHASTAGVAGYLPPYAGRLMQAELEALSAALEKPQKPVTALVGGAKVSTKLELLSNLVTMIDALVIGGGMANTFLYAKGYDVGASLCEKDMAETARRILAKAEESGCKVILPKDVVIAEAFAENAPHRTASIESLPQAGMILDVGPETVAEVVEQLKNSKTLVWNGPMGAFEISPFDAATVAIAKAAADLTKAGKLLTYAGGGDTVAALSHAGVAEELTYLSTAGGAFLEWLEGKTLPGVAALAPKVCGVNCDYALS